MLYAAAAFLTALTFALLAYAADRGKHYTFAHARGQCVAVCWRFCAGLRGALGLAMTPRRFVPPWSVEETAACFVVKDQAGQSLAYLATRSPAG